jgi:hypothetical protein
MLNLVKWPPHRRAAVVLVKQLGRAARVLARLGCRRAAGFALRVAGRLVVAVDVADDVAAGRCVPFAEALPALLASWERDQRALGQWPPAPEDDSREILRAATNHRTR